MEECEIPSLSLGEYIPPSPFAPLPPPPLPPPPLFSSPGARLPVDEKLFQVLVSRQTDGVNLMAKGQLRAVVVVAVGVAAAVAVMVAAAAFSPAKTALFPLPR